MVALRGKEIDAFLAKPDPARPIVLLYGPDAGLVRERADALTASAVDDPNDPFSLVKIDGDELAAEPSRLVDEAMTVPLFGGRRAIRIRAGTRNFASGIDTLAQMEPKDCRIVIEAGELRPDAPLRKACEKAKSAVAIACYADTERDLARLIDDEDLPWEMWALPIADGGVPEDEEEFIDLARDIADELRGGVNVLIHCYAGIGRTGTLAIATLMALGVPPDKARRVVEDAGAGPESYAQERLIERLGRVLAQDEEH